MRGKSFQYEYSYNAWKPGIKDQIEKQTLTSGGVRDISRNLGISKNTVISELKKNSGRSESAPLLSTVNTRKALDQLI